MIFAVEFFARLIAMCSWSVLWQAGGLETWLENSHWIRLWGVLDQAVGILDPAVGEIGSGCGG